MIPKSQTDLTRHGTFFSLVVIYLMNLILISAMLVIASGPITFADFGAEIGENVGRFLGWLGGIADSFSRGYHH